MNCCVPLSTLSSAFGSSLSLVLAYIFLPFPSFFLSSSSFLPSFLHLTIPMNILISNPISLFISNPISIDFTTIILLLFSTGLVYFAVAVIITSLSPSSSSCLLTRTSPASLTDFYCSTTYYTIPWANLLHIQYINKYIIFSGLVPLLHPPAYPVDT